MSILLKEKKMSSTSRLQREINAGRTSIESFITPKNIIDSDSRTITEQNRLLSWANAFNLAKYEAERYYIIIFTYIGVC